MRAIVIDRYGPPETLRIADVPDPEPAADQVLVAVRATAVNDWDWCFVRGRPYPYRLLFGLARPKVSILGAEVAGTVVAVGPGATRFRPGDDVYGDISEAGLGGFAELVAVPESALEPKPVSLSYEEAAALPHAAMLAWQGLVEVGGLQPGERVLVNGAGGGVGTLGLQIAKRLGAAEVTGVDRDDKLAALTALGYDDVLDYRRTDFTRTGRRWDLVLDTKTTRSPFRYMRALESGGRYVTVGGSWVRMLQIVGLRPILERLSGKRLRIVALRPNDGLDELASLFDGHRLETVIDGPHPFEEVPAAVRRFGEADHVGKIVIRVDGGVSDPSVG